MSSPERSLDNKISFLASREDKNTEEQCVPLKLDIPIRKYSGIKSKTIFSSLFLARNPRQCACFNFSRAFRLAMILKNPKICYHLYHSSLDPPSITVRHSSVIWTRFESCSDRFASNLDETGLLLWVTITSSCNWLKRFLLVKDLGDEQQRLFSLLPVTETTWKSFLAL